MRLAVFGILIVLLALWLVQSASAPTGVHWTLKDANDQDLASVVVPRGWQPRRVQADAAGRSQFVFAPVSGSYPYFLVRIADESVDDGTSQLPVRWSSNATPSGRQLSAEIGSSDVYFCFFTDKDNESRFDATARQIVASARFGTAIENYVEATPADASSPPRFRLPRSPHRMIGPILGSVLFVAVIEFLLQMRSWRQRIRDAEEAKQKRLAEQTLLAELSPAYSTPAPRQESQAPPLMGKDAMLEQLQEFTSQHPNPPSLSPDTSHPSDDDPDELRLAPLDDDTPGTA